MTEPDLTGGLGTLPPEEENKNLLESQILAGCAECRFADDTRLGCDDVCQHEHGYKMSFGGQKRCARKTDKTDAGK